MGEAPSMKMSVVGCGYLGAVHAAAMAELGHEVIGVEVDPERAAGLAAGTSPFYEPGLDEMLGRVLASGKLRITSDIADASEATIHFLCVGTPQTHGHNSADLTYVENAVESILTIVKPGDVVVGKSTVPVGTALGIAERIHQVAPGATLIWNPEFLREGLAIEDTLRPDRVVMGIGALPEDERARDILVDAYAGILSAGTPLEITNYPTAELVKVAANAFLATKISFINAMADLCELAGADVTQLADAIGHDARIGRRFLNAGLGFGGGCLPKDIRAFMHRALELGAADTLTFLREVDIINVGRREKAVDEVREWLDGDLLGRRIAVLGAAFKPDSDDIRDSPALAVAEMLHLAGADVVVTDPRAIRHAQRLSPALTFADTPEEAAEGADIVLLLTEWREYVDLDPVLLAKRVHTPRIFDCRNALNAAAWVDAGWEYRCLGRPLAGG